MEPTIRGAHKTQQLTTTICGAWVAILYHMRLIVDPDSEDDTQLVRGTEGRTDAVGHQ